MQGKKGTFCISCVKILAIVSKCWHRIALFLVLSGHQRSQEFETVGEEAFLMMGITASEAEKEQLDEALQGQTVPRLQDLKTTFLGNYFFSFCIFKMYIEKAKLCFCVISQGQ